MQWQRTEHRLKSAFKGPLPVAVFAPSGVDPGAAMPLLWVHDGPAYEHAGLLEWLGGRVDQGSVPPMRIALADVRRRTQWYSASPRYLRSFSMGLTRLETAYAVRAPVVVMGASLGGLTALLAGLRDDRVGGVFAQSGSFFTARTDGQESGFAKFDRITNAVSAVPTRGAAAHCVRVEMTCGAAEENIDNNRLMAAQLLKIGLHAELREVPGGHDYQSWMAALDPSLPQLLNRVWAASSG